jgi:hypothetical protein
MSAVGTFRKVEHVAQEKEDRSVGYPGYVTDEGYTPDKCCKVGEKPEEERGSSSLVWIARCITKWVVLVERK